MSGENHVYKAIADVTAEMSKEGIAKGRKNQQQGYSFRGIDEVLNALSPVLSKHKLVILPRMTERECVERQSKNGGVIFYVTVKAEFDFVSAVDGSKHTVSTYGEAMDSADKATNKAMSAAYKYAAFQTFCIPTEGDNDADATTHDVAPKVPPEKLTAERKEFIVKMLLEADTPEKLKAIKDQAKAECQRFGDEAAYKEIINAVKAAKTKKESK
ncbi:ERF family protein [Hymenobacter fodinae]|uniref:Single-stranded DNA-binding protein n=1 Tax=Hymenobacter fodinae TaxID=2510796 RepID=A0A4Z0P142_9BACT|nr:ERF family protein [Hymenobacter fodinae]TGE04651.1 single-stranded DNA-binding protein [Hymenobacter fodinae]